MRMRCTGLRAQPLLEGNTMNRLYSKTTNVRVLQEFCLRMLQNVIPSPSTRMAWLLCASLPREYIVTLHSQAYQCNKLIQARRLQRQTLHYSADLYAVLVHTTLRPSYPFTTHPLGLPISISKNPLHVHYNSSPHRHPT